MARKTKDKVKEESKPYNTGALHPGGGGTAGTKVNIPERPSSSETEIKEWN